MAVMVLLAAFFLSVSVLKRGSALLSVEQRQSLTARGPSIPYILLGMSILVCALFTIRYPIGSVIAATALTAVMIHMILRLFNDSAWPLAARRLLLTGNGVLALGSLGFVIVNAAGFR